MFICGNNFVGGALTCAITPTNIDNINYVELKTAYMMIYTYLNQQILN